MLVTGVTAIVSCSPSAGNSQPPSTSHAQCRAVSMDGQRRGCSGNQLRCPKTSVDDCGHRQAKARVEGPNHCKLRRLRGGVMSVINEGFGKLPGIALTYTQHVRDHLTHDSSD